MALFGSPTGIVSGPIIQPGRFVFDAPPSGVVGGPIFPPGWPFTDSSSAPATTTSPLQRPLVAGFTTLPAQVPIVSTAPSPVPVVNTGTPIPSTVGNDPTASTVLTSASLPALALGELEAIITSPSQHIIGVIVLLAIGWFIWKHR